MPSLLENLQRRLDDLPIPDILHRSHSSQPPEPAPGLEASPRLRVRPFPHQLPQARQPHPPAPGPFPRLQATHPSQGLHQHPRPQPAASQPQHVARPTWNAHAEPPVIRQGILASEDWLSDLPDTPEAPRASAAAQRQAVADVLFEAAAGESAVGENESVREEPSWLDDAAAYDAAAAQMEEEDMNALEILSDGDDSPVHAVRSQARLNLSHLEHLLLSDSEEEDDGHPGGSPPASDRQSTDAPAQASSMMDVLVLDSEEEANPAAMSAAAADSSNQPASQVTGDQNPSVDQACPDSPPEVANGHDGRPRVVMSDVTSRFPTEQQLPQQLPEDASDKPSDGSFQLQRRSRQPRACRGLLPTDTGTGAAASNSHSAAASTDTQDGPMLRPVLRSAARSLAMQSASLASEPSSTETFAQTGRSTRRQARLNQQPSQSSSHQAPQHEQVSQADLPSDDDFAVLSRPLRSNRSAAASQAASVEPGTAQLQSRNKPASNGAQAGAAEQAPGVRKNRPRLQLNRNPARKGAEGTATGSGAAGRSTLASDL